MHVMYIKYLQDYFLPKILISAPINPSDDRPTIAAKNAVNPKLILLVADETP